MSKKRRNILLAFIIPALLFYVVFWISPVLMSFYYGLTNWRGMGDFDIVGMKNYANLIKQGTLFNSMGKYNQIHIVRGYLGKHSGTCFGNDPEYEAEGKRCFQDNLLYSCTFQYHCCSFFVELCIRPSLWNDL